MRISRAAGFLKQRSLASFASLTRLSLSCTSVHFQFAGITSTANRNKFDPAPQVTIPFSTSVFAGKNEQMQTVINEVAKKHMIPDSLVEEEVRSFG